MRSRLTCRIARAFIGLTFASAFLLGTALLSASCTSKSETASSGRGGAGGSSGTLEAATVNGQIAVETGVGSGSLGNGQPVRLVDEGGTVHGEGKTDASGAFTLQIGGAARLTDGSGERLPPLLYVSSLFLANGTSSKTAVGVRNSILLDPSKMPVGSDGIPVLDSGSHRAHKVGAIVGSLKLETGGSNVGIDVFVPGTTYIAKTDDNGDFLLGFLPRGTYTLRAERDGYASLEWNSIVVGAEETVDIGERTLKISTGPQINEFSLVSINDQTGKANLTMRTNNASKYRVSKLSDFADTVFHPIQIDAERTNFVVEIASGAKVVNVYLEAADNDGLSATRTLTIDREAPTSGSISVATTDGVVGSLTLSLTLASEGATGMRIAETALGLSSGTTLTYATSYTYTLTNTTEGARRIYVAYLDAAGNTLGGNGEISTGFTLDRTPPDTARITLLNPESPTGAFNTPLAWTTNYDAESNVTYTVQVLDDEDHLVRTMTTGPNETSVVINPPLEEAGTYFWRVKPTDSAGNASSSWVRDDSKKFVVKLFATGYLSKRDIMGNTSKDQYSAKNMLALGGDLVAFSVASTEHSDGPDSCIDCGVVRIQNVATNASVATLSEFLDKSAGYGNRMTLCDIDNNGTDELIVSAPGASVQIGQTTYAGAGKVFAYSTNTYELMASLTNPMTGSAPIPPYSYCSIWNENPCTSYGWGMWPQAIDYPPWSGSGRFFGWDISCKRNTGADTVLVGEPGYATGANTQPGAVWELTRSAATFTPALLLTGASVGDANWGVGVNSNAAGFGTAVTWLNNFKYDCAPTDGSYQTESMIAVGSPQLAGSADYTDYGKGGFSLFYNNGGTWSLCAAVLASGSDFASYAQFGAHLFALGNIDKDGASTDELAVSTHTWGYGVIKIFGSTTKSMRKALDYFGTSVATAGDWETAPGVSDDVTELAVGSPTAAVLGQWNAGKVQIYEQGSFTDAGSALRELTYSPASNAHFGASILARLTTTNDIHADFDATSSLLVAAPGRNVAGRGAVGAIHMIGSVKLATSLPTRIAGTVPGANMGQGVSAVGDVDNDSVPDFILGQPGMRCNGMRSGAISVYSVATGSIIRDSCPAATISDSLVGSFLSVSPQSGMMIYTSMSVGSSGGGLSMKLLDKRYLLEPLPANPSIYSISASYPYLYSNMIAFSDVVSTSTQTYENIAVGDPSTNSGRGRVSIQKVSAWSWPETMCGYEFGTEVSQKAYFGSAVSFATDANNDSVRDVIVSAPGFPTSQGKGAVFVVRGRTSDGGCSSYATIPVTSTNGETIVRIDADATAIMTALGRPAYDGFGTYVVGLPNLGIVTGATAYVYVANTNIRKGASAVVPEAFVFAYKPGGSPELTMVWHDIGAAGSMFGSNVKLLGNVDGDSVGDFAIACPGCQGRLGNTGQVKILSGANIVPNGGETGVIQMLYNPDPQVSNFGVSIEYADATGDGIADFVIGADKYSSNTAANSGAVYIFQVKPIQE